MRFPQTRTRVQAKMQHRNQSGTMQILVTATTTTLIVLSTLLLLLSTSSTSNLLLTRHNQFAQAKHVTTQQLIQHQKHHHEHQISECSRTPNVCQNGATCVTKPGGQYQCLCVNGWEGQNCTVNVDDCTTAACENGATCHDRVGHFYCECPPGKTGLLCQLDDGCFQNPCHPNATCDTSPVDGRAVCTCPPGFSGIDCSIDNDECAAGSPCEHGGTCVNVPGTFRCDCAKGFTGTRCEVDINECAENPCVNGGSCLDEQGGYRCICQMGYKGQQCEIDIDECAPNPCHNGATCKDEINAFRCLCPAGFWGERCELNASNSGPPSQVIDIPNLSPDNPWSNCPEAFHCWTAFSNGRCDLSCNIAECLYDGKDCASSIDEQQLVNSILNPMAGAGPVGLSSSSVNNFSAAANSNSAQANQRQLEIASTPKKCDDKDSFCLRNYANGICDQECNSPECGWDGLDCEAQQIDPNSIVQPPISSTRAQGLLVIRVEPAVQIGTDPESKDELTRLLRNIYSVTKTVLKIQSYRDVDEGRGTEIELIADNRRCLSSCFNSTDLIARFLTALRSKRAGFNNSMSAGSLRINNIYSKPSDLLDPEHPQQQSMVPTILVVVCGAVVTVCAVFMVISIGNKQRETKKAFNWFPEGFKPVTKSSRSGGNSGRDPTDRKGHGGGMRGISTLSAVSGNFIRNFKSKERNISTDPSGLHSTDIDRSAAATPSGGGIYHEPYDYDQYGSTYIGSESIAANEPQHHHGHHGMHNHHAGHHQQPMTPSPMSMNPINIEGPHGMTPLMVASMGQPFSKEPLGLVAYGTTGEVDSSENNVTDLLNRGAQLNLASKVTGETALHLAARCGRADNASRLLAHCDSKDVNAKDATGRTPLHAAIAADSLGVFELLIRNRGTDLNAQTHDGTTPLILAAKVGNYSMLEELILNECEVTKSDSNGKTALHWAAAVNNVDIIRRLLSVRETNKDAQDLAEETPLFLAAREGARGAVEILMSHNANKDIKDQLDVSPIDIARAKKHDDIVRLLEEYEPTTPRSITAPHHSRQISPLSPDSTSNSNQSTQPPPPPYLSYTHLTGNLSEGGRKAQRAAAATMPEAYSVPCLKNFMTPSPDSPYSMESMVSPPVVGYTSQQYQNHNFHQAVITSTKQAGVFI